MNEWAGERIVGTIKRISHKVLGGVSFQKKFFWFK